MGSRVRMGNLPTDLVDMVNNNRHKTQKTKEKKKRKEPLKIGLVKNKYKIFNLIIRKDPW